MLVMYISMNTPQTLQLGRPQGGFPAFRFKVVPGPVRLKTTSFPLRLRPVRLPLLPPVFDSFLPRAARSLQNPLP